MNVHWIGLTNGSVCDSLYIYLLLLISNSLHLFDVIYNLLLEHMKSAVAFPCKCSFIMMYIARLFRPIRWACIGLHVQIENTIKYLVMLYFSNQFILRLCHVF